MSEKAEACGLPLPEGWRARFPTDPQAPSIGTTRGWGKAFVLRAKRKVGRDPSESVHPTAVAVRARPGRWHVPALRLSRRT